MNRLSPDSSRKVGAQRFAAALRSAMAAKEVGAVRLARATGVSASAIGQYRMANNIPTIEVASRLAAVLGSESLVRLAEAARTIACEVCGRTIAVEAGSPRRFCSEPCRKIKGKRTQGVPARDRAVVAERMLTMHRSAVAEMCRGCEPTGVCHTIDCALRPVSPFQMAPRIAGEVRPIDPRAWGTDAQRYATREANARRWTPEERERWSVIMTERHAAMTPEERTAFRASVSEGRRKSA